MNSIESEEVAELLVGMEGGRASGRGRSVGEGRVGESLYRDLSALSMQSVLDRSKMRDLLTRLILDAITKTTRAGEFQDWVKLLMQVQDLKRDAAPSMTGKGKTGDPSMGEAMAGVDVAKMLAEAEEPALGE